MSGPGPGQPPGACSDALDLAVLGAGPAGLWAARAAATAGASTVLLERSTTVGGLAGSFTVAGVRVDHGSHRLHAATDAAVLAQLEQLLGADLQLRPRRGRIRLQGRWIDFPLTPTGVVRRLPPAFAARALLDTLTAPLRRPPRDPARDTYADQVRARLGPTMLEGFYGPYARKLWGLPPEQLAGEQARRRIAARSPSGLLRTVLRGADPSTRTFRYPRRGFGQLWEALADDGVRKGVDLRTATAVTGLAPVPGGVQVRTDAGSFTARTVFSTLPVALLPRLWDGPVPAAVTAAAEGLVSRAMVLVYLVVEPRPYTPFDAHYLPETWTPVTRISEPTNYRSSADDPSDHTVLCAELPCQVGDAWWRAGEQDCARVVVDALTGAGLPAPRVREVVVRRVPSAYPVLDVHAPARLQLLEEWVATLPGVRTFGRQGLFAHDNSHHAIAMASAAVDSWLAGEGAAAWQRRREAFRGHVVVD